MTADSEVGGWTPVPGTQERELRHRDGRYIVFSDQMEDVSEEELERLGIRDLVGDIDDYIELRKTKSAYEIFSKGS